MSEDLECELGGEGNGEGGTGSKLGGEGNLALEEFDESVNDGESKAGAVGKVGVFGGDDSEIGVKDVFLVFWGDS